MRILVTGCGGFIGSHLLDALLKRESTSVVGWDYDHSRIGHLLGHERLVLRGADLYAGDSEAQLRDDVRYCDAVINLAAICNPSQYNTRPLGVIRSNFIDAMRTVDLCAEQGRWLIHVSTSEVYGRTLASYTGDTEYSDPLLYELDEDRTPFTLGPVQNQRWSYACAKQLMERYVYAHRFEHGMPFTIIRPLNFFGPRMDFLPGIEGEGIPRVLACFLSALLRDEPLQLVDGGQARRVVTGIDDAIDAFLRILDRREVAEGEIFNIGNPANETTIRELAERMRRIFAEVVGDARYLDHPLHNVAGADFYGPGYEDSDRRLPRIEKARSLLGWEPVVPLDAVLRQTIVHYVHKYWPGERGANAWSRAAG